MSPDAQALAAALRSATRQAHHQLDHHPLLAPLLRADLTLAQYRQVLLAMAWVHTPLQSALRIALKRLGLAYPLSDRAAWLAEDFAWLGGDARSELAGLAPWPVPDLATPAAIVGALYVIEGSTLGGKVIARQLAAHLGLNAAKGARFFHGHGAATEAHWGEFWQFAAVNCPPAEMSNCCAAAIDLFARFESGLSTVLLFMNKVSADISPRKN